MVIALDSSAPHGAAARHARPSAWLFAILVLGLNLWSSFDLIPALHLRTRPSAATTSSPGAPAADPGTVTLGLVAVPPAVLGLGLLLRHRGLLLGGFPVALLAPVLAEPRLVGVDVHGRFSFLILAVSLLAYTFGTALALRASDPPPPPVACTRIAQSDAGPALPDGRRAMYLALAALAALCPAVLVGVLFLDPEVQEALRRFYPERAGTAAVLFGVLVMGTWLALFFRYFHLPLRDHIRGDRRTRAESALARHRLRRARPRPQFYFWVVLALSVMAALLLTR